MQEVQEWNAKAAVVMDNDPAKDKVRVYKLQENCNLLNDPGGLEYDYALLARENARLLAGAPSAYYDGIDLRLEPGEQTILPAIWSGLPSDAPEQFFCLTPPGMAEGFEAIRGRRILLALG